MILTNPVTLKQYLAWDTASWSWLHETFPESQADPILPCGGVDYRAGGLGFHPADFGSIPDEHGGRAGNCPTEGGGPVLLHHQQNAGWFF